MSEAVKIVYANRRKPGVERRRWVAAWREHAGIAMMCDDYFGQVSRYVQGDAFATWASGVAGDREYDGVGEFAFRSLAALTAANASRSRAEVVEPHGRSLFGSPDPISLIVEEHRVWHARDTSVKVYTFVQRPAGTTRPAFADRWAAEAAGWAAGAGPVRGYVRDIAVDPAAEFDGVEGLSVDTIGEAYTLLADARAFVRSLPLRGWVTVLTRQAVLRDDAAFAEFDALVRSDGLAL